MLTRIQPESILFVESLLPSSYQCIPSFILELVFVILLQFFINTMIIVSFPMKSLPYALLLSFDSAHLENKNL